MKPRDFERVIDMIENFEGPERLKFEQGLLVEIELTRSGNLDEGDQQIYRNWREWLEGPQQMRWSDIEKRYVGANNVSFIKGELRHFLEHFGGEYVALCETCDLFFIKTIKRPQRFCKRRGRACRDEYHTGKRKTPEGRKEWAAYMRGRRATKRRLRKGREKRIERELLAEMSE